MPFPFFVFMKDKTLQKKIENYDTLPESEQIEVAKRVLVSEKKKFIASGDPRHRKRIDKRFRKEK